MSEEIVRLLTEIRDEARAQRIIAEVSATGTVAPATDKEDLQVRFDPKPWKGPSFKGKKMSACPAAFLELLAEALTNIARQEQAEKKLYKERPAYLLTLRVASRARRWAIRKMIAEANGEAPAAEEAPKPAGNPFAAAGSSPYGTSGFGANAKHTAPPEKDDDVPFETDDLEDEVPL